MIFRNVNDLDRLKTQRRGETNMIDKSYRHYLATQSARISKLVVNIAWVISIDRQPYASRICDVEMTLLAFAIRSRIPAEPK